MHLRLPSDWHDYARAKTPQKCHDKPRAMPSPTGWWLCNRFRCCPLEHISWPTLSPMPCHEASGSDASGQACADGSFGDTASGSSTNGTRCRVCSGSNIFAILQPARAPSYLRSMCSPASAPPSPPGWMQGRGDPLPSRWDKAPAARLALGVGHTPSPHHGSAPRPPTVARLVSCNSIGCATDPQSMSNVPPHPSQRTSGRMIAQLGLHVHGCV